MKAQDIMTRHRLRSALIAAVVVASALLASCGGERVVLPADHPAQAGATEAPPIDTHSAISDTAHHSDAAAVTPPPASAAPSNATASDYTCPMHAEVSSPTPGRCPTCGMQLKPRAQVEANR